VSGFLLDTNILIDAARRVAPVERWLAAQDDGRLFTCSVVAGELYRGFHRLPGSDGERWLLDVFLPAIEERILPFDFEIAILWGRLMAEGEAAGRRPSSDDAKIAATALMHGLVLVTRNVADYQKLGVALLDPRAI
jgi:predicted nucleic acid-binding protein